MREPKWHLITVLDDAGLLKLLTDLDRLYNETGEWGNAEIRFRIRDGKYDVNVLTKDYKAIRERVMDYRFEQRYRETEE